MNVAHITLVPAVQSVIAAKQAIYYMNAHQDMIPGDTRCSGDDFACLAKSTYLVTNKRTGESQL